MQCLNNRRQQGNLSNAARTGEEADLGWRWSGRLGCTKEVASVSSMPSRVPLSSSSPMPANHPHSPTLLLPPRDQTQVAVVFVRGSCCGHCTAVTDRKKRKEKPTHFSADLTRSLAIYRAAQL